MAAAADRPDSSDAELRRALAGFAAEVGPADLQRAVQHLGAALDPLANVLGDYRIGRELGRGGMGVVYEAEQISVPGRKVAVKVLLGFGGTSTAWQRFAREVEVVGQLDHPHIVPILSAEMAGPRPFYAMKKIDGVSLRDLLCTGELRNECRRIATMIRDLARALHHAHERGVVHRDVKPSNVVIDTDGRAMLLDFGLARVMEEASDLTHSLDAVGTPDYMAPEQVARHFGPITARTDVYSLGITLFECLCGRTPFATTTRTETLDRIVRHDAPHLRTLNPAVPRDLENVCAMAMERDPAHRYPTAAAFAADLEAFLAFHPVRARPAGWGRRALILTRRHRLVAVAAAAALLTLPLAYGYWGWWVPGRATSTRLAHIESLWGRCAALEQEIDEHAAEIANRQRLEPHPGHDAGLGTLQLAHRRLRIEQSRLDADLEAALDTCLALDPGHARARARSADLVALQLRRLLQGGGAVTRRDQIDRQIERLRRFDEEQRHVTLLDTTGDLSVRCDRGAARVWLCGSVEQPDGRLLFVDIDDPAARDLGNTPVDLAAVEGSYALRAMLPGHEPAIVPVLVRRRAVQTAAERTITLRPATAAEIGSLYRQVHGGFMVAVADRGDPLLQREELRWVDGFAMTEREVRIQDVVEWLGTMPPFLDAAVHNDMLAAVYWPQIAGLLHDLNQHEQRQATGHYITLPTPEQWQWAGQGADGRPYPWGWLHDWKFSQNYWSSVDRSMALLQQDWPEEDVSPFGIRDLAGSLREVLLPESPMRELGNKQFLLGGGCYYSFRADDLTLWESRPLLKDVDSFDVGLRLVRMPLPALPLGPRTLRLRPPDQSPLTEIPAGWRIAGSSGPFFEDLASSDRVRIEDGNLGLYGFAGGFSPQLVVWHPLSAPSALTKVSAAFEMHGDRDVTRSVELRLGLRPDIETHDHWLGCSFTSDSLAIAMGGSREPQVVTQSLPAAPRGGSYRLQLVVDESAVTVTLWRGEDQPLVHRIDRPADLPADWNYVAVRLPTFIGLHMSILDLTVGDE